MENTDIKKRAKEVIEIITAKLDPDLMSNRFDEPIAEVACQFEYEAEYPVTHKDFHKIIADFSLQIYEKALKAPWILTDPLDEAIVLLENGYHSGFHGPGYTGAMLHTNDTEKGGIEAVHRWYFNMALARLQLAASVRDCTDSAGRLRAISSTTTVQTCSRSTGGCDSGYYEEVH